MTDKPTAEEQFTEYRHRIHQYYWKFLSRSKSYIDAVKSIDPESEFPVQPPIYMVPLSNQRGNYHALSYSIKVPIGEDFDTIREIIDKQLVDVLESVKKVKADIKDIIVADYIRDSKGRKIAPSRLYKMFDNALVAYDDHINKVKLEITAVKIKPAGFNMKSALNHTIDLRKKAQEFIERAENGTFPYSKKNEW